MKKFIIAALLLVPSVARAEILASQVNNVLSKFCIPKPNDVANDGERTCGGVFEGIYRKGSSCDCASNGDTPGFKHLVYDPNLRRCKPRCPVGYFVKKETNKTTCGVGQYKLKISK